MTKHSQSVTDSRRKTVFDIVRGYPDLTVAEIETLAGFGVGNLLTQLADANMISRYKKTIPTPDHGRCESFPILHHKTTVAEYRWERKKRAYNYRPIVREVAAPVATPEPTIETFKGEINRLLSDPRLVASSPKQISDFAQGPMLKRASDRALLDPRQDKVSELVETIQGLPYRDVIRLKTRLAEVFA